MLGVGVRELELRALRTGLTTAVHVDTLRTGTRLALPAGPCAVAWVDVASANAIETEGFSAESAAPASGGRSEAVSAEPCNHAPHGDAPVSSVLPERLTTLRVRPGAAPAPVSLLDGRGHSEASGVQVCSTLVRRPERLGARTSAQRSAAPRAQRPRKRAVSALSRAAPSDIP